MVTVFFVLVLIAIGCAVASAIGKAPLWISVFVLCLIELLRVLPLGK
jgi:hypothetical protein